MQEELIRLGLSKNEAIIYLFLLKNPNITTGLIIKETGISNSRVYESLNSLILKGLVNYTVQKEGKYFNASPPEKFLEKEEERIKQIEILVPELKKIKEEKKFRTNTAIYEGFEGFKTAFQKIIDDCPKEDTIYILGFSEQQYAKESLRTFLTNMNLRSQQKRQRLKILLDSSTKEILGKDREKEKNTEVRYMPKGYINPSAIDIFQDCVYIFLWEEKPFVFMIKNERIAESFKQYFNFLWKLAKP
ncbi:TrmB family transcriptional regulator [Candidatus Pacearchaeota archaeon]|nr:TrmB family transcriptional regulator [Candidatus Pacearchaeota archaeon]